MRFLLTVLLLLIATPAVAQQASEGEILHTRVICSSRDAVDMILDAIKEDVSKAEKELADSIAASACRRGKFITISDELLRTEFDHIGRKIELWRVDFAGFAAYTFIHYPGQGV